MIEAMNVVLQRRDPEFGIQLCVLFKVYCYSSYEQDEKAENS